MWRDLTPGIDGFLQKTIAMLVRFMFILLLSWMTLLDASAQREFGLIGVDFQVGLPQGAFKEAYDETGFGGCMDLYFKIREGLPLYAGLNLSLMGFEQLNRDFTVLLPGGFYRDYRLRASSNLFSGYGGFRIMPQTSGWFKPYAEGLIGFKNFYISKRLEERQDAFNDDWEEVDRDTDGDWTIGYGGSAGILFFFGDSGIALDLKCSYLAGGKVSFFKLKEDIDEGEFESDPFSAFDPVKATTNMLIPQVGLVFRLDSSNTE